MPAFPLTNPVLSPIDRRLASRLHQRKIEAVLRVETAADESVSVIDNAIGQVLATVASSRPVEQRMRSAAQLLRDMIPTASDKLELMFRRLAHWSYGDAIEVFAGTIPRRWMRLVNPVVLLVGEAEGDLTPAEVELSDLLRAEIPTEPVAKGGRLSDKQWTRFLKENVFSPLTADRVQQIIERPTAGESWRERFEKLSRKINDPQKLAGELVIGFSQGESLQSLSKRVEPLVQGIKSSARRIARTEGLRVANEAQRETYEELGPLMQGVQILATLDENTRPHHSIRHGTVYYTGGRKKPSISELPVLPDEPNCRCFDAPVLTVPEELKRDPRLLAEFQNAGGAPIPDPSAYTQWFERSDAGRRKMAVGSRRYNSMVRQLGDLRDPEWTDFIDEEGKLLSVMKLRAETERERIKRKGRVQRAMDQRQELLRQVSGFGFVTPTRRRRSTQPGRQSIGKKPRTASSIAEAEKIARDLNLADTVNYKGLHVDVANEMNVAIHDTLKLFPEMRTSLEFVGSSQGRDRHFVDSRTREEIKRLEVAGIAVTKEREKAIRALFRKRIGRVPGNAYALSTTASQATRGIAGITINEKWGKAPDTLRASLRATVASGFHPAGTDSIKAVVDHELGHQIDIFLALTNRTSIIDEGLSRKLGRLKGVGVEAGLSTYATYDWQEFTAEAWSEFRNARVPRPIAAIVGEHILQKQAER